MSTTMIVNVFETYTTLKSGSFHKTNKDLTSKAELSCNSTSPAIVKRTKQLKLDPHAGLTRHLLLTSNKCSVRPRKEPLNADL